MGLLSKVRDRRRDMATLTAVLQAAEGHARVAGDESLAAHHLLLAAFDMTDGTSAEVFEAVGADAADFGPAIETQHANALRTLGVDVPEVDVPEVDVPGVDFPDSGLSGLDPASSSAGPRLMRTDATFEAALAATRQRHLAGGGKLLGWHVVAAVASVEHGVSARALDAMGIDRADLIAAAERLDRP